MVGACHSLSNTGQMLSACSTAVKSPMQTCLCNHACRCSNEIDPLQCCAAARKAAVRSRRSDFRSTYDRVADRAGTRVRPERLHKKVQYP